MVNQPLPRRTISVSTIMMAGPHKAITMQGRQARAQAGQQSDAAHEDAEFRIARGQAHTFLLQGELSGFECVAVLLLGFGHRQHTLC